MYPTYNPPRHPDRSWTCPERDRILFFWGRGGVTSHKRLKIEGSINLHNCIFALDSLVFNTCHFPPLQSLFDPVFFVEIFVSTSLICDWLDIYASGRTDFVEFKLESASSTQSANSLHAHPLDLSNEFCGQTRL